MSILLVLGLARRELWRGEPADARLFYRAEDLGLRRPVAASSPRESPDRTMTFRGDLSKY